MDHDQPDHRNTHWRVLFVEDDEDLVEALSLVIDERIEPVFVRTIAEARSVLGACPSAPLPFDAACVDLELPDGDGTDVIRELSHSFPGLPVVVLTVHRADTRILAAFRAGARGYLLKEQAGQRLVPALLEAIDGGAPLSPAIARRILGVISALPDNGLESVGQPRLTDREVDVLRAFASGQTYTQTAAFLGISVNTLRTHVRNAYEKLCVGTRTEAVMSALQLGLLSPTPPTQLRN